MECKHYALWRLCLYLLSSGTHAPHLPYLSTISVLCLCQHHFSFKMPGYELDQSSIPVIDISDASETVAQQVLDAASKHGFLYIKNDGVTIPPQDIDDMFSLVRRTNAATQKRLVLTKPEQSLLRLSQGPKGPICNPLRQSRRHKPRLGIHARRIAGSTRTKGKIAHHLS